MLKNRNMIFFKLLYSAKNLILDEKCTPKVTKAYRKKNRKNTALMFADKI